MNVRHKHGLLRVFSICGDAGGAAAVAPVLRRLKTIKQVCIKSFAYGPGVAVLKSRGVEVEEIPLGAGEQAVVDLWRAWDPDVLLSASSVNADEYEKICIRQARLDDVPSLVVMDSWSSYGKRFGPREGEFDALPDMIALPDARSRLEWIAAGVPENRLSITGHPAFDELAAFRASMTPTRRMEIRTKFSIQPNEWMVVFLSQPIRQLTQSPNARFIYPGYNQYEVFSRLVLTLQREAVVQARSGVIVVRPHPREDEPPKMKSSDYVRIVCDREFDVREIMMASDLVTGMASIALVEACYLGCLTLSLQPGALYPEAVASNIAGVSASVRTWDEFDQKTAGMLFDSNVRAEYASRLREFQVDGKSTDRVVDLLLSMTNKVAR